MKIHVLQHEPFEGPAAIEEWARERGHILEIVHIYRGDALPDINEIEWLILMGGAMSVNDEAELSWLVPEKQLVRAAIEQNKRVLGICLGAQMIASALGARIFANTEREIGWWPIEVKNGVCKYLHSENGAPTVLHWHGETFDLPSSAQLLASSEACENQAFTIGNRVVGLQFHLESTSESVQALVKDCADELLPDHTWIQSAEQLLSTQHFDSNRTVLWNLLDTIERA